MQVTYNGNHQSGQGIKAECIARGLLGTAPTDRRAEYTADGLALEQHARETGKPEPVHQLGTLYTCP
jgi:hypothetical protein